MRGYRRALVRGGLIAAAVAALSLPGGSAHATPPGPGVTGTVIAQRTVGGTDYILRELTIPPGQATGWHYHDGPVRGYIARGTLSHYDATCASDGVYPAGSAIEEGHGPDAVHFGRNEGSEPLVLYALYVLPHGAPLANDAPNPGCDFE
ncbi:cupin domain-containing protein [Streptomyces marincola]|uniref:cupin domain-containing protein n=1 Tax=Streptomyces marincola TaxID=2878388 RepID=UPI001CF29F63|nr:cupin domain-containing protein [Streptomyces marincola]UCM86458.1 cupin domain-containing protein [Streptomyces marincola]